MIPLECLMLNMVESIHKRVGPATVKWFTTAEQRRQFDTIVEALSFARRFDLQQKSALWIEFAEGETMFGPDIS